jgi:hypothetical protein
MPVLKTKPKVHDIEFVIKRPHQSMPVIRKPAPVKTVEKPAVKPIEKPKNDTPKPKKKK